MAQERRTQLGNAQLGHGLKWIEARGRKTRGYRSGGLRCGALRVVAEWMSGRFAQLLWRCCEFRKSTNGWHPAPVRNC
jgi:hypothetical protein